MISLTRRNFAAALAAPLLAGDGKPIRLGGPIFLKSSDPRELAREHRRLGYSAAYCPEAKVEETALVREIEKAFAAENVVIAEVGAWVNMLDPDAAKARQEPALRGRAAGAGRGRGSALLLDIAGSYNPTVWYGPHPKNLSQEFFDATVENCRRVIDEVKPKRTRFTIEMMGWSLPDGPDAYLKLIRAVDRRASPSTWMFAMASIAPPEFLPQRRIHFRVFSQAGAVDRLLPRQGPAVDYGVERAFSRSGSRPRAKWTTAPISPSCQNSPWTRP